MARVDFVVVWQHSFVISLADVPFALLLLNFLDLYVYIRDVHAYFT